MLESTNSHGSGAHEGAGGVADDGEDQEDPSSSSSYSTSVQSKHEDLESFRAKWRKEINASITPVQPSTLAVSPSHQDKQETTADKAILTDEEKARQLFLKGVDNEQLGKLYEAIQFYKKAVQLVPDIEFRLYESTKNQRPIVEPIEREAEDHEEGGLELEDEDELEDFDPSQSDLMTHLQRIMSRSYCICQPKIPQQATHISALPMEIILYILRWVVSSDLDLRSLEICSTVCRGFYICCRDQEIWRLACIRVWGVNCGGMTEYKSWREMFISRPRLHFNGCYISKTTYVRSGENSFQDQFYRPWHFVQYYRYLRFFPEGLVLMLTTADEPLSCLGLLKGRQVRHPAVMVGHYRLCDDRVTLTVQKQDTTAAHRLRSRKHNNHNQEQQTFHLEFEIVRQRAKSHSHLRWRCYSVFSKSQNGYESSCPFEVVSSKYPPLWFSRVKSYTAEADYPLM